MDGRPEVGSPVLAGGGRGGVRAGTFFGMDTSWWLALAAVVLLALVATLVDGWGRRGRRAGRPDRAVGRTRPPGRPPAGGGASGVGGGGCRSRSGCAPA
ncbi:hypothetical protein ACFXA6_08615, partial [Streptomyces mirabilis]